jgi:hypothetical protein
MFNFTLKHLNMVCLLLVPAFVYFDLILTTRKKLLCADLEVLELLTHFWISFYFRK